MPLTPAYYSQTVDRLNSIRPIRAKKMFGGAGLYHDEVFFAILDDDKLFFKVDEESKGAYEAVGMGPWVCNGEAMNAYRELPASILADDDKLGDWIEGAVAAARRLKKGKK